LIKLIIKIIRKKCNMWCYSPPPLKRNLVLRFAKEEAQENDEGCIGRRDQRILDS
jgi:hypothetical protein